MENINNTPEDLIECGLNLSKLNQYMNNKFVDCVVSPPFLLSQTHAKSIIKSIKTFKLPSDIFSINEHWWLRSPGDNVHATAYVSLDGIVYDNGGFVHGNIGVRPAFCIVNPEDSSFKIGDKVKIANIPCTVVLIEDDKTTVLCDDYLFKSPFNKDPNKGNDYETSDVKQELESYFKDKELKVEVVKSQSLDEILSYTKPQPTDSDSSKEIPDER